MTCPGRTSTGTRFIDPESTTFPEVDASKDIVVECPRCKATAAVSVHDLVRGKAQVEFRCQTSEANCEARLVAPEVPVEVTKRAAKSKA